MTGMVGGGVNFSSTFSDVISGCSSISRRKILFHFWRQILILSSAAISPHPFPVPLIPMLQILPNALDLRFKYSFAFRSNIWETEKSKFKFGFRTFFSLPNFFLSFGLL